MRQLFLDPYASEFMRRAAVMAVLIGVLAPVVGVWVILRRLSYLGDAMSHASLSGVAAAYLLGLSITLGALAAGVVMGLGVTLLGRQRRLARDAAIGVVETVMFAAGILLISQSRSIGVDLPHYLFGQIVTVDDRDLMVNGGLTVLALGLVVAFFADLRSITFDPLHARQVGVPVAALEVLVMLLISISVVVSLDTVGLLMSVAMLVTPAATARMVTTRMETMTAVAVAIGVGSALGGLTLAYHLATPPGPSIALVAAGCFAVVAAATWPRRSTARRDRHGAPAGSAP